ncbi:hypothetical protein WDW37_14580 [Bdellovibrionota bacterium FG-1]
MLLKNKKNTLFQFRATVALLLGVIVLGASPSRAQAADLPQERNFYDVLEDVMGDFEFDLKNGNVTGLRDVSVRNVAVSENVPTSFKSHLELLISEKILKNTKSKVIQCLPCKARKTTLNGEQVVITSPETNPAELSRIAKSSGIEHFIDVAFTYQPSGMVLSMTIIEPETGSIVWSRSYNSETTHAAAFRRGVDYSQTDDARKSAEYTPTMQYRGTAYYLFEPNMGGMSGCLGLGFRMVERYDNRRKEVGFEFNYLKDVSTLTGGSSATAAADATDNIFGGINATVLFVHGWNFIGDEENFNKVRSNLTITTLNGEQVVITSPETNPAELSRIAKSSGIEHFIDVAFTYQPSGMVLSMTIIEPETGSIVWSRSYNSETTHAAAFRRGVDYSQTDDARKSAEYTPTMQYRGTAYYLFEPNMGGMSGCLGLGFRMVERYDNRRKEVGFEFNYLKDVSTLTGGSSATAAADATDNIFGGINATVLFVHGWNFIGDEENFNKVRSNLTMGLGGTYSSGFLGGLIRASWEWRLGKHFSISAVAGYRPSAMAYVGTAVSTGKSVGGAEFGVGISLLK